LSFPQEMQLSRSLSEDRITRCYAFGRDYRALLEENLSVLNVTWFSNEAHFHLDGYVNNQNVRFWASGNSGRTVANRLHPERVTVWCALLSVGIFWPVFIDGVISSEVYLSLLSDDLPFLDGTWHSN
jgi:hypothetical protein